MGYKGRLFNREGVFYCGDYLDGDIYPVFQQAGKRRKRCKPTSEIQERLNQKNAEKTLTRTVHMNFDENDLALHLTYRKGVEPADEAEALRNVQNFLRRAKRRYRKTGIELKYVYTTEYGKKNGRVHHHLILTGGIDRNALEELWGKGYANSKRLQFEDDGVTGLAHYMTKDKRRNARFHSTSREEGKERCFYRRWSGSRNLLHPEPSVIDGQLSFDDIGEITEAIDEKAAHKFFEKRYPGYVLTEAYYVRNSVNRGVYIHFEMRRRREDEYPGRRRGART